MEFSHPASGSLIRRQSSETDIPSISLVAPGALRAAPTDSSLTTRSKFTTHLRIDLTPGNTNTMPLNTGKCAG